MGESLDAGPVIDRLRELYQVKTDRDLSAALGAPKTTVSSWRTRNRVPFEECVQAVRKYRVSFDWLLLGEGPRPDTSFRPAEEAGVYQTDPRLDRLVGFLSYWHATRNEDDQVWLEMQLSRAVPEYAEWIATRGKH